MDTKKIALEEHFSTPQNSQLWNDSGEAARNGQSYTDFIVDRLWDDNQAYLDELNRLGIERAVMSLTSPGVQGINDPQTAVDLAHKSNDEAYEHYVKANPNRFSLFAAVALQDPKAAADEAERAVKELGAKGILINGYTNMGDVNQAMYLDDARLDGFWSRINDLHVPVYLHPREPMPASTQIYQGYPELIGSAWGFTQETAVHAIRLIMSGLFDRYPDLTVILGHLGEGLSQTLPRTEHRLYRQRNGEVNGKNQRPLTSYLQTNFMCTTSGHFNTDDFKSAIAAFGPDRVMFSVDYPYEDNADAANWFDQLALPEDVKKQIAYGNAQKLLNL
ncbi:amidohydrolase family protein [Levilactobacillus bambusae]|uniref:Amidohydrolase n=1 Tax=Levilactobacillus bambusae TaxID=2024736 RepID=A0A2V1N0C0_9LACO|nr:amidohydrolase family protein [Levilactobacillus bambusae]PWF99874.1 amidohydrolase [Levilactobacillus bambusae]